MPSRDAQLQALAARAGTHPAEHALLNPTGTLLPDLNPRGHSNQISKAPLTNGELAWWKAVTGNSAWIGRGHTPNTMTIAEGAAWQLATILGPPFDDLVAPCRIAKLDFGAGPSWGSLALNMSGDPHVPLPTILAQGGEQQLLAAAFFDALIGNQDRNRGNYLWDPGSGLALIDHSLSFPGLLGWRGAQDLLNWRCRSGQTRLLPAEEAALARLLGAERLLASFLDHYRLQVLRLRSGLMALQRRVLIPLRVRLGLR